MRESVLLFFAITLAAAMGHAESYLFKMIKDKVANFTCNTSLPIKVCKVVFKNGQKNEFYYRSSGELERVLHQAPGKEVEVIYVANSIEVGKDRYKYEVVWTLKAISRDFQEAPVQIFDPWPVHYGGKFPYIHNDGEWTERTPTIDAGLFLMSVVVKCPLVNSCRNDLKY